MLSSRTKCDKEWLGCERIYVKESEGIYNKERGIYNKEWEIKKEGDRERPPSV